MIGDGIDVEETSSWDVANFVILPRGGCDPWKLK